MKKGLMAGLVALFACNTAGAYVLDCEGTIFADDSYRIPATVKSDLYKKIGRVGFDGNSPQSFALDLTVPIPAPVDISNPDAIPSDFIRDFHELRRNLNGMSSSITTYKPKKKYPQQNTYMNISQLPTSRNK
jgi:hypothetical protein